MTDLRPIRSRYPKASLRILNPRIQHHENKVRHHRIHLTSNLRISNTPSNVATVYQCHQSTNGISPNTITPNLPMPSIYQCHDPQCHHPLSTNAINLQKPSPPIYQCHYPQDTTKTKSVANEQQQTHTAIYTAT